jgi:hypothetical protein
MPHTPKVDRARVEQFVEAVVGEDLHAKRVLSLANTVGGALSAAALSVHAIGHGLAQEYGLNSKHAIKQVDRLLSNGGIDPWKLFGQWVPQVVGARTEIVVALDWTDFDRDGQSSIVLSLITAHGRATPLVWKTVLKADLEGRRNEYEDDVLRRLAETLPKAVAHVRVLADRGFGDQKLYEFLGRLRFDFIIRFRGVVTVTDRKGVCKPANDWVRSDGRAVRVSPALLTSDKTEVGAFVCVHAPKMKAPWFLACGSAETTASDAVRLYGKRFTIEENFRDTKNPRLGLGLSAARTKSPDRRDRLLLVAALAEVLLTLLGAAAESVGFDRLMKANTVKHRTYSLFRQGLFWYGALPNMREDRLATLMKAFDKIVRDHAVFTQAFGLI